MSTEEEIIAGIGAFSEDNIQEMFFRTTRTHNYKWWYRAFKYYLDESGDYDCTLFEEKCYRKVYDFIKSRIMVQN